MVIAGVGNFRNIVGTIIGGAVTASLLAAIAPDSFLVFFICPLIII